MLTKFKLFVFILFIIFSFACCTVLESIQENASFENENTYNKKMYTSSQLISEEHLMLKNDMYKMITNPILQNSSVNSAYPLKMTWTKIEDGNWYISKIESSY